MTSPNLTMGSMLLGSTQPDVLREWYRTVFAPDHEGDGGIQFGGFYVVFEKRDDVADKANEPGRMIHNFHVDDIEEVAARLNAVDVDWVAPVEDRGMGFFCTFLDPDGNYLQLIQFKPEP